MAPVGKHLGTFLFKSSDFLSSVSLRRPPALSDDYAEIIEDDDYALPATKDYEIPRDQVSLIATIGEGQFGDVHKGAFKDEVRRRLVPFPSSPPPPPPGRAADAVGSPQHHSEAANATTPGADSIELPKQQKTA